MRIGPAALEQFEVSLSFANQPADIDLLGQAAESNTTVRAPDGWQISQLSQLVDDFHDVVARDAMTAGDLADGDGTVAVDAEIHQHAQRIVGIQSQLHCWFPSAVPDMPRPDRRIRYIDNTSLRPCGPERIAVAI